MKTTVGIVLAAGLGNRLRPLTEFVPKPALPFMNRALMCYSLDVLWRAGVDQIGVNGFHHAEQISGVVGRWRHDRGLSHDRVCLVTEERLLGTGGGGRNVWTSLGEPEATVVLLNGDIVADFDLGRCLREHTERGQSASLITHADGEGRIHVGGDPEQVIGLPAIGGGTAGTKGGREVSFCGASILSSDVLRQIPAGPGCLLRSGLAPLCDAGLEIASIGSVGTHVDVGTPGRYWRTTCRQLARQQALGTDGHVANGVVVNPPVCIGDGVRISPGARVGPWVVLGGDTHVRAEANLHHMVGFDTVLSDEVSGVFRIGAAELDLPAGTVNSRD